MTESSEQPGRGKRIADAARRLNRNPKLLDAAKRSRRRAVGDDELLGELSGPRGRPADLAAEQLASLRGDEHGVLGEIGMAAVQSWQRLAERQDRGRGKVDVAIMFTDLVDFSSWALSAGDSSAIRLLREVGEAIEPPIEDQHGEVVKRLGDGLMAAFWSAPSAVEAAFAAAERSSAIEVDGYRPVLRTGIHLGRPRRIRRDYFGVDVNIAARLADAAKPGEVLVSDSCLSALDRTEITAKKRRFRAKGAPTDLGTHAIARSTA